MPRVSRFTPAAVATCLTILVSPLAAQQAKPTVAQFLSPSSPLELVRARNADRVAWVAYERGMRNVYTAAAPDFKAVRLTSFMQDDGVDVSEVDLSDDGSVAIFMRGTEPNRQGWNANPTHDPRGAERAIWAVRTAGGPAWRVAAATSAALSPDGRTALYVRDGQIFRARITPNAAAPASDSLIPFIKEWGRQSNPRWSPDGGKVAFVSDRDNHAFIGIYDTRTRRVDFVAPSVDCDAAPAWSLDGKQLAFIRRPGLPFGMQAQEGSGGIGNPPGPASGRGRGGAGGCLAAAFGRGGGGAGRGEGRPQDTTRFTRFPGLYRATFKGGYNTSVMVADVSRCPAATGPSEAGGTECSARELWHNAPNDSAFATMRVLVWAGNDRVIFPLSPPDDEWDRYYSIAVTNPASGPVMLTTTNGLIEDATSAALSRDGKTLYYCTNANDIEKRHIWAVATSGGTPRQVSTDDGIETSPQPLASGKQLAVLYFDAAQPASVGLVAASGGATR